MLRARELDVELFGTNRDLDPEKLVYTHGFGSPPSCRRGHTGGHAGLPRQRHRPRAAAADPSPHLLRRGDRPYVVTRTTTAEFDYPLDADVAASRHDHRLGGDDRRRLDNPSPPPLRPPIRRPQPAHQRPADRRLADPLPADIEERVPEIAPFLYYDPIRTLSTPMAAWSGSGTPTRSRALSEPSRCRTAVRGANYVRNTSRWWWTRTPGRPLLLADPDEPIVSAYAGIFPGLFEPLARCPRASGAPPLSRGPVHRPEPDVPALPPAGDRIGATTFYNQDDRWAIPEDVPPAASRSSPTT